MKIRSMLIAFATTALVASLGTAADAKRHKQPQRAKPLAIATRGYHQEPARMIEVKPGLWISSWGCIVDEGYGRYSPCDIPDAK